MKIYLIEHFKVGYDWNLSHIIVADNEAEVRELAKQRAADEGKKIWDTAMVTIQGEYTGEKTYSHTILSDFNAG